MPIDSLPAEILVQILDDPNLTLGDLAVISRVSRSWNQAVIPNLYKCYTFRYCPNLEPADQKELKSFQKYGRYVRSLMLHLKPWERRVVDEMTRFNLVKYLEILDCFPEVTTIEYYDLYLVDITWSAFWAILNHLLSGKPRLTTLNVIRRLSYQSPASAEADLGGVDLYSTPPLLNLRNFSLRINGSSGGHDNDETLSFFLNNMAKAIGDSCRNVSKLELKLDTFGTRAKTLAPTLFETKFLSLKIDNPRELVYSILPIGFPTNNIIDADLSKVEVLTAPFWVCKNWPEWGAAKSPHEETSKTSSKLKSLCVTYQINASGDKAFWTAIEDVAKKLPDLEYLILEEEDLRFEVLRGPQETIIWKDMNKLTRS
ncbi:hypothetical protein TWF694_003219 [Orbilia ellipsospora]|uniref:F-box domain-containing protein n=1 Tax=Orbilia ellipsospora TaxID=2528407 RepID=A0AAV9X128_9PEZI